MTLIKEKKNRGFENVVCNNTGSSVVLPLKGFDKSIQYTSTEHATTYQTYSSSVISA